MNSPTTEKRAAARAALRINVVVSGRLPDGAAWSEPTETIDVSTAGAVFTLNQKVAPGDCLTIRAYLAGGSAVEAVGTVARVATAVFGTTRVAVSILAPADGWLRLFDSWASDDGADAVTRGESHVR